VLRYAGAAYLVYLGYRSWTADDAAIDIGEGEVDRGLSTWRVFRTAFVIGISNPKALLFAAAFLPQFIDATQPKLPQFGVMVLTFSVIEISWYFVYALGGRGIAGFLTRPGLKKAFNRLTGSIFVAFGLALVGSRVTIEELAAIGAEAGALLKARGETLAVVDGATGGLMSAGLLAMPGASAFFLGSGVIYTLKGRRIVLGHEPDRCAG
jgi:hypothetical protein